MRFICFFIFLILGSYSIAQINLQDSSVQVITFWDLNESHTYDFELKKREIKGQDTLKNITETYLVDISIVDSTQNSYTVRWHYRDAKSDAKKLPELIKNAVKTNLIVDFTISELGEIQEFKNWGQINQHLNHAIDSLKNKIAFSPSVDTTLEQTREVLMVKAEAKKLFYPDIHQYHNFYGGKFRLQDTVSAQIKTPNIYQPNQPFDSDVVVILENIDKEENEYLIRSFQTIDSKQIYEASLKYVRSQTQNPNFQFDETFSNFESTIEMASIIHNTGWIIESQSWKTFSSDSSTTVHSTYFVLQ